jgi:hypothetical protein
MRSSGVRWGSKKKQIEQPARAGRIPGAKCRYEDQPPFSWRHSGFSAHGAVCVQDREGAVRLGRYMIRCPIVWCESFSYRAASWDKPRRVVAKVEWHRGELFSRVGFIVTNLRRDADRVVKFYNGRGVAEQWIKEGKNPVKRTKLSCHDFVDNQVRLQLFALAYNLGNFLLRVALPPEASHWSLTTLQGKLIKIGAKVVSSARYVTFQMAEVAVPQRLFQAILRRISRLMPPLLEPG